LVNDLLNFRQVKAASFIQPPPPPPPPPFHEEKEEGNLADGESSTSYDDSDDTRRTSSSENEEHRNGTLKLTLTQVTQQFYASNSAEDPVLKPSFLRTNKRNGSDDSGYFLLLIETKTV
jgi:hypothetical protein